MKFKVTEEYELMTEANLNRIVNGHDKEGFAIISAFRQDCLANKKPNANQEEIWDENNIRTNKLKKDLFNHGYSYVPAYGGYKETNSDKASVEKAFIVFPFKRDKTIQDFNEFENNIKQLGKNYNQDAILIKEPNRPARYFDLKNNDWDSMEFNNVSLNDLTQEYFTSLKSWSDISLNKKGRKKWDGKPQRFSFNEFYINKSPETIMGAHARQSNGELISMHNFKK